MWNIFKEIKGEIRITPLHKMFLYASMNKTHSNLNIQCMNIQI
jgi:hypothetical protein